MKKAALLIAVLLLSAPARAIELSLEENRGDRGSVGYVDMQRLFSNSPDAQRAKEAFEELVRQAEERVNLRKAELLKLHQELDATRAERDALSLSMMTTAAVSTAAAVAASTSRTALSSAATASGIVVGVGSGDTPGAGELEAGGGAGNIAAAAAAAVDAITGIGPG